MGNFFNLINKYNLNYVLKVLAKYYKINTKLIILTKDRKCGPRKAVMYTKTFTPNIRGEKY